MELLHRYISKILSTTEEHLFKRLFQLLFRLFNSSRNSFCGHWFVICLGEWFYWSWILVIKRIKKFLHSTETTRSNFLNWLINEKHCSGAWTNLSAQIIRNQDKIMPIDAISAPRLFLTKKQSFLAEFNFGHY